MSRGLFCEDAEPAGHHGAGDRAPPDRCARGPAAGAAGDRAALEPPGGPPRLTAKNRAALRQEQGAGQRVRLALPASEVKNRRDLEHPLPPWVVELLDLYLARGRPVLQAAGAGAGADPWLFPGARAGEAKTAHAVRQQVKDATEKGLGLQLTPHQFRHACGLVYLMADPGGHEVVRHLLGHRSLATTIRHYAGMEAAAALRHYDAVVLERRQEAMATPTRGGRRRG